MENVSIARCLANPTARDAVQANAVCSLSPLGGEGADRACGDKIPIRRPDGARRAPRTRRRALDSASHRAGAWRASAVTRHARVLVVRLSMMLVVTVAAATAAAQDKPPLLRLTVAQSPAFPLGKAAERWAQLVTEASGGAFEVKLHPGAVLAGREPLREFSASRDTSRALACTSRSRRRGSAPPIPSRRSTFRLAA